MKIDPLTRYDIYRQAVNELKKYDSEPKFEFICFNLVYVMKHNGWSLEEAVKWAFENSEVIEIENEKRGWSLVARMFKKEAEEFVDKCKRKYS